MAYWSVRRPEWRDGERYIAENSDRIRAATGRPDLPVHPVGGIADGVSVPEVEGMLRASAARGAVGLRLYDWRTSNPAQWAALAPIRRCPGDPSRFLWAPEHGMRACATPEAVRPARSRRGRACWSG